MWQRCPICDGRGWVSGAFYTGINGCGTSSSSQVLCRTCNGVGIISALDGTPKGDPWKPKVKRCGNCGYDGMCNDTNPDSVWSVAYCGDNRKSWIPKS